MNKKFDDLLEDDLACFLCALIAFALFFGTLTLVLGADAFQRWLLCMYLREHAPGQEISGT